MKKIFYLNSTLIFCFLLSSCDTRLFGTEGTNPKNNGHLGAGTGYSSDIIINSICDKRSVCRNQTDSLCLQTVSENTKMTTELRLNPPFRTLTEVLEAEKADHILTSAEDLNQCLLGILNLDCASILAQTAFADTYDNIDLVLQSSTACARALTTK